MWMSKYCCYDECIVFNLTQTFYLDKLVEFEITCIYKI